MKASHRAVMVCLNLLSSSKNNLFELFFELFGGPPNKCINTSSTAKSVLLSQDHPDIPLTSVESVTDIHSCSYTNIEQMSLLLNMLPFAKVSLADHILNTHYETTGPPK